MSFPSHLLKPSLCFDKAEEKGNLVYFISSILQKELDFEVILPSGKKLQRGLVWTQFQKEQLILSKLKELYIPPITVLAFDTGASLKDVTRWKIIDGKQRLTTLLSFYNNEFPVNLDNKNWYFKDLPINYQSDFARNITFKVYYEDIAMKGVSSEQYEKDLIALFKRLNFAGTQQDVEHLNYLES